MKLHILLHRQLFEKITSWPIYIPAFKIQRGELLFEVFFKEERTFERDGRAGWRGAASAKPYVMETSQTCLENTQSCFEILSVRQCAGARIFCA